MVNLFNLSKSCPVNGSKAVMDSITSSNKVILIAVSEFSAGNISITSPLTLKQPLEKSKSFLSYCIETKRKIIFL